MKYLPFFSKHLTNKKSTKLPNNLLSWQEKHTKEKDVKTKHSRYILSKGQGKRVLHCRMLHATKSDIDVSLVKIYRYPEQIVNKMKLGTKFCTGPRNNISKSAKILLGELFLQQF